MCRERSENHGAMVTLASYVWSMPGLNFGTSGFSATASSASEQSLPGLRRIDDGIHPQPRRAYRQSVCGLVGALIDAISSCFPGRSAAGRRAPVAGCEISTRVIPQPKSPLITA